MQSYGQESDGLGSSVKVLDLFSGIGGFSLGLERAGMETIAFCEFDEHAQKVLRKHWPDVPIHSDVRSLNGHDYRGTVDVVCGGFPCQDLSTAGKRIGFDGERSSLYGEMLRVISECMPRYAIFENVTGLISGDKGRWFAKFLYDLAEIGFDAEWHCITASDLGAHHHRDRVWIIAYPSVQRSICSILTPESSSKRTKSDDESVTGRSEVYGREIINDGINGESLLPMAHASSARSEVGLAEQGIRQEGYARISVHLSNEIRRARGESGMERWSIEPKLGRLAHGVPNRSHRLKQLGNAVVPQIPEAIGRAIMEVAA
jgi:DNA (cytosine-5)-methyltransferase 1